jgi:hypothetical protein
MDFLLKEFSKCVLLCSNCHREVHHPEMEIESITLLVSNNEKK